MIFVMILYAKTTLSRRLGWPTQSRNDSRSRKDPFLCYLSLCRNVSKIQNESFKSFGVNDSRPNQFATGTTSCFSHLQPFK